MVFLKPSMIKFGFFLVAGSQDQVQRRTQKAESLQAGQVIPTSLPETSQISGSHSWPRAGQPRTGELCADGYMNLPRRRAEKRGRDECLDRLVYNSEREFPGSCSSLQQEKGLGLQMEKSFSSLRNLV